MTKLSSGAPGKPSNESPPLALYCEPPVGVPAGNHSQGGAQGSCPQEGPIATGQLAGQKEPCMLQEPVDASPLEPDREAPTSHNVPLLTELHTTLAGKGEPQIGSRSVIAEQVMKGELGHERQQIGNFHNELS